MKRPTHRSLAALGSALAACCLAGSCSTTSQHGGGVRLANNHRAQQSAHRIAQLDHGREPRFTTCDPSACPAVTPKTIGHGGRTVAPRRPAELVAAANPIAWPEDKRLHASGPAPASTRPLERDPRRTSSSITELVVPFASGSATLTAAARLAIDQALKEPAVVRLAIRGRTDSTGPLAVNEALASDRARSVQTYLRNAHPRLAALPSTVDATGACCYVATNATPEGRARNRRVEIDIERTSDDP